MTECAAEGAGPAGGDDRDPRLGLFALGGELDGAPPSGHTVALLDELAAPPAPGGRRFAGSEHDEDAGMLAAAAAAESHAGWLKLTAAGQLIRRHAPQIPDGGLPGPDTWDPGLLHEIAATLRISWQAAWPLTEMAWHLEARLPATGELLRSGILSWVKTQIITSEFSVLDDAKAAEAEKRLLEHDLGADDMTPGKLRRLGQRLADVVDPDGAARRREQKERDEARVSFFRAHGGAGAMVAAGLPADDALRANANIQKRALAYKAAGIREKMDFLRVLGLVDLSNGVTVPGRRARWQAEQAAKARTGADSPGQRAWESEQRDNASRDRYGDPDVPFPDTAPDDPDDCDDRGPGGPGPGGSTGDGRDPDIPPFPDAEPPADEGGPHDDDGPSGGGGSGDGGSDSLGSGGSEPGSPGPVPAGMPDPGLPSLINFTLPLATVLGQAQRPGEVPGYGSVDPALARKLAAAATESPRSEFCVTFTDEHGHAAAHGCAKLIRAKQPGRRGRKDAGPPGGSRDGPVGSGWNFAPDPARTGPDGGSGAWILTLPDGRRYRVAMHGIPLHECDHRDETEAYRPGALLRHLVEIRDGECTFTGCSHPARLSDFDHATPYHQGGKTCACNGGARSRRCHRVKQCPGWSVTQPRPGWHRWTTPSGRSFTKGPKTYPA